MGPLPVPDKLHENPCLGPLDPEMWSHRKQKGLDFAPIPDQLVRPLPLSFSRDLVGKDPTIITLQVFQNGLVSVVNAHPRHVLKIPLVEDADLRENQTALSISEARKVFRRDFPRSVPERPSTAGVWDGRSPPVEALETSVEGLSNLPLPRRQRN